jgi:hypothetical protein
MAAKAFRTTFLRSLGRELGRGLAWLGLGILGLVLAALGRGLGLLG